MILPQYTSFDEKMHFFETNSQLVGKKYIIDTKEDFDAMMHHINNRQLYIENKRQDIKENIKRIEKDKEKQQKWIDAYALENGLLFRGVGEAKYKMFTSSQRYCIGRNYYFGKNYKEFIHQLLLSVGENTTLKNYYKELGVPCTDILYLSILQHFGAFSPLLDISYNVNIALYFALKDAKIEKSSNKIDNYCSLYVFDTFWNPYWANLDQILQNGQENAIKDLENTPYPIEMIDTSNFDDPIKYGSWSNSHNNDRGLKDFELALVKLPTARGYITPTTRTGKTIYWGNSNLLAQKGGFFLYNEETLPLEEYVYNSSVLQNVMCYNIKKDLRNHIIQHIAITDNDIYPRKEPIVEREIQQYKNYIPNERLIATESNN